MRKKYETDLTNEQWDVIKPVNMRKYKWEKRELVNAIFTVNSFYRRARLNGLWDRILEHLEKLTRQRASFSEEPLQALIDSQRVV